jgi:hypothetical protein
MKTLDVLERSWENAEALSHGFNLTGAATLLRFSVSYSRSRTHELHRMIAHRVVLLILVTASAAVAQTVDVRIVSDEADAAMAILRRQAAGGSLTPNDWRRLFDSEGYRALKRREGSMGRAFTDSAFEAFLRSDTLRRRTDELARALPTYERLDATSAGSDALRYLPRGARIRATLFPMIKPITNSFVFTLDSVMAIYMYVDPTVPAAKLRNTLTHELHHVGYGTVCDMPKDSTLTERQRFAIERSFAFGEGLAMLAAAGSADVHPHAVSPPEERARWDGDVRNFPTDVARLQTHFLDVIDGRLTLDSAQRVAMSFYGIQGPWYTVGWVMGSTIERVLGRDRLIAVMCDPRRVMATYNQAAVREKKAVWSAEVLRRLGLRQ